MLTFRAAFHRCSLLLLVSGLLYGPPWARATEAEPRAASQSGVSANATTIALLLPTGSDPFAAAAQAVRAGFSDAARKAGAAAAGVRVYSVSPDPQSVVAAYRQAVIEGARLVVGPLTRSGVSALAAQSEVITVPTLALNVPEHAGALPASLYTLNLNAEAEARQIARLALQQGRMKALTFSDQTVIGRRMRDAFVDEFQRGGGEHVTDDQVSGEPLRLKAEAKRSDMAFLAIDVRRLPAVRDYASAFPLYGTSQLNPGLVTGTGDVPDMRFIDMPWMLQPDHPAVAIYARQDARQSDDIERLYALGIDAFRVAQALLGGNRDFDIDGVTGRLTLGPDGYVRRALLVALIAGGAMTILGETAP